MGVVIEEVQKRADAPVTLHSTLRLARLAGWLRAVSRTPVPGGDEVFGSMIEDTERAWTWLVEFLRSPVGRGLLAMTSEAVTRLEGPRPSVRYSSDWNDRDWLLQVMVELELEPEEAVLDRARRGLEGQLERLGVSSRAVLGTIPDWDHRPVKLVSVRDLTRELTEGSPAYALLAHQKHGSVAVIDATTDPLMVFTRELADEGGDTDELPSYLVRLTEEDIEDAGRLEQLIETADVLHQDGASLKDAMEMARGLC